jgi:hypothetical protein
VLISPGTLPGSAAQALRHIADRIEGDRRLLSARHWHALAHRRAGAGDRAADDLTPSDHLDQA